MNTMVRYMDEYMLSCIDDSAYQTTDFVQTTLQKH